MEMQLGLLEAIKDLLILDLRFIIGGILLVGTSIFWLFKKDKKSSKLRIASILIIFYYYLCVVLSHIVGLPTLKEFFRLSSLGESLFSPNINLVPLVDGISLEVILNILCFIPLGFFCPLLSKLYKQVKKVLLIGFGLSFVIEISQLFTLYRATDINDLIANTLGTLIGYLCYNLAVKLGVLKSGNSTFFEDSSTLYLPIMYLCFVFILTIMKY